MLASLVTYPLVNFNLNILQLGHERWKYFHTRYSSVQSSGSSAPSFLFSSSDTHTVPTPASRALLRTVTPAETVKRSQLKLSVLFLTESGKMDPSHSTRACKHSRKLPFLWECTVPSN